MGGEWDGMFTSGSTAGGAVRQQCRFVLMFILSNVLMRDKPNRGEESA